MAFLVSKPAPEFQATAVVDGQFRTVKLADYRDRYVVLFFYPLDFTFVCPTEVTAFSDRIAEFKRRNCEVLGVSVDSQFTHLAWINTPRTKGGLGGIRYPLVADLTKKICADYGVLLDSGMALRGLFLIDPEGVIRHALVNDLPIGRNVDEVLRVLDAWQFFKDHGEMCPAGWTQGAAAIKPSIEGAKEYFANVK